MRVSFKVKAHNGETSVNPKLTSLVLPCCQLRTQMFSQDRREKQKLPPKTHPRNQTNTIFSLNGAGGEKNIFFKGVFVQLLLKKNLYKQNTVGICSICNGVSL